MKTEEKEIKREKDREREKKGDKERKREALKRRKAKIFSSIMNKRILIKIISNFNIFILF